MIYRIKKGEEMANDQRKNGRPISYWREDHRFNPGGQMDYLLGRPLTRKEVDELHKCGTSCIDEWFIHPCSIVMCQQSIKTVEEFEKDFGENWRDKADKGFVHSMDHLLGKCITDEQSAELYKNGVFRWNGWYITKDMIKEKVISDLVPERPDNKGETVMPHVPVRDDAKKICISTKYTLSDTYPKKHVDFDVYFNGSTTTVKNNETGKLAISKCDPKDEYDPFIGFCVAFTSVFFGSKERAKKICMTEYKKQMEVKERKRLAKEKKSQK